MKVLIIYRVADWPLLGDPPPEQEPPTLNAAMLRSQTEYCMRSQYAGVGRVLHPVCSYYLRKRAKRLMQAERPAGLPWVEFERMLFV